jgi:hypothetical protein
MHTDFYIEKPEDPRYDPDKLLEDDELALLISQIKMILLTKKKTVLGSSEFGIDADSYLFDFSANINLSNVEAEIRSAISNYCTLLGNRRYSVNVVRSIADQDMHKEAIHVLITLDDKIKLVMAYY